MNASTISVILPMTYKDVKISEKNDNLRMESLSRSCVVLRYTPLEIIGARMAVDAAQTRHASLSSGVGNGESQARQCTAPNKVQKSAN